MSCYQVIHVTVMIRLAICTEAEVTLASSEINIIGISKNSILEIDR